MYGKDYNYANTRIAGTLVRMAKTDEPLYVYGVHNNGICQCVDLRNVNTPEGKLIDIHLDDLNIEPVRLGYVNCAGQAAYLMRIPVRRGPGNQGLRNENSQCSNGRRLFSQPLDAVRNCIMNKYPPFKTALADSNNQKTIAFHRYWAIQDGQHLYYKENLVGICIKGKPTLNVQYKYLQEALEESL